VEELVEEAVVEEVVETVDGDAVVATEEVAPADVGGDDDEFFLDTTGDAAATEGIVAEDIVVEDAIVEEVVAEEPIIVEEDQQAVAEPEPEVASDEAGDQLFGTAVAESFSFDLDDSLEESLAGTEEPAAKKQKLDGGLSLPIESRQHSLEEGLESPLADGLPDNLDELEATPLPIASPAFKPPSAKWSGAVKRPASIAIDTNRSLPKVVPQGSRLPVMPSTPKASFRPPTPVKPFQPKAFQPHVPRPKAPTTSPYAPRGMAAASAPSQAGTSTAQLNPNEGFVFICNSNTAPEVASKRLCGSPDRELPNMKQYIKPDTQLFLLNMETLKMLGPFAPNSKPEYGIVKAAFGGRFNAQVRVMPTPGLMETQLEKKCPSGPKDAAGMKLMRHYFEKANPAPINVLQMWGITGDGAAPIPVSPMSHGGPRPVAIRPTPVRPLMPMQGKGMIRPNSPMAAGGKGKGAVMAPNGKGGATARADKFVAGCDKEGRQYNLNLVVVNFANVGASYAGRVLKKDNNRGDRLFDWEGVRKCVKCLTQELGLQVVGCVFENYWGPDRGGPQVPIPDDIRAMCNSIQETPSLTGKNHKSADDEMTIKCAYRRNCRFMDNDNYRDWLREMRDQRIRNWLQDCQEMLQMRYFFDTDLGSFDTLDGNVPVGLLAEGAKQRGPMGR